MEPHTTTWDEEDTILRELIEERGERLIETRRDQWYAVSIDGAYVWHRIRGIAPWVMMGFLPITEIGELLRTIQEIAVEWKDKGVCTSEGCAQRPDQDPDQVQGDLT